MGKTWTILALVLLVPCAAIRLNLTDGGYSGIVVAIHESVPYNPSILANIEALFSSASKFLLDVTRRFQFKEVTVVVPSTWPKVQDANISGDDLFGSADVRVVHPRVSEAHHFTVQPEGCGQKGRYIQFSSSFIAGMSDKNGTAQLYGDPAYHMVHEWARYRYGVYPEYGVPGDNLYQVLSCSNDGVYANSCSGNRKFTAATSTGEKCKLYRHCRFAEDCIVNFYEDETNPSNSSIMFLPYLKHVKQFCTKEQHNSLWINPQNSVCRGKSTAEVVEASDDYKNSSFPSVTTFKTTFRKIQQSDKPGGRIVLAIDVSKKMELDNHLESVKRAGTFFLRRIIPDGVRLSVVTFSEKDTFKTTLTVITNRSRIAIAAFIVNINAGASAECVTCGIDAAKQVLESDSVSGIGGMIIFVSAATENDADDWTVKVIPWLEANAVTVNTVIFGPGNDSTFGHLSRSTRGESSVFSGLLPFTPPAIQTELEVLFLRFVNARTTEWKQAVKILHVKQHLNSTSEIEFVVAAEMGKDTMVHIIGTPMKDIDATLVAPDTKACAVCKSSKDADSYLDLHLPSPAMHGSWKLTLEVKGGGSANVSVLVTTRQQEKGNHPVRTSVTMVQDVGSGIPAILADVWKASYMVVGADVMAIVQRPNPPDVKMKLRDDGIGADAVKDDGTYSGAFVQFNGKGHYKAAVEVAPVPDTKLAKRGPGYTPTIPQGSGRGVPSRMLPMKEFILTNDRLPKLRRKRHVEGQVPLFSRLVDDASFELTRDLPPGEIRDLRVTDVRQGLHGSSFALLSWTSRGAYWDSETASIIEIRASLQKRQLSNSFGNCALITEDAVVNGSLTPLPPGQRQSVNILIRPILMKGPRRNLSSTGDVYLAARVTNGENVTSSLSNVVRVSFQRSRGKPTIPRRNERVVRALDGGIDILSENVTRVPRVAGAFRVQ